MNDESKTKKDLIKELKSLRRKVNRLEKAAKLTDTGLNEAQSMAHIGSWELDLVKDNLIWSDEIYRIFEIDPEKFGASYEAFLAAIHPEDREAVNSAYTNSLKSKIPYSIDHRLLFSDDRIKFVHEECKTFYDENGNAIRSVGTVQDITERKHTEESLRESETKFRSVFESSVDAIGISKIGIHTFMNQAYLALFGYDNSTELIGKPILELIAPSRREQILENVRRRERKEFAPTTYVTRGLRKDGSEFDMDVHASTYELDGEDYTLVILRDISDRVRAEQELRESEEKFAAAFNSSPNLMAITRMTDSTILDVNEGYSRLLGYSRAESIGKTTAELSIWANLSDRNTFIASLKESGHITDFETTLRRKDGTLLTVIDSACTIKLQGETCILSIVHDITERKRAEEARLFHLRFIESLDKVTRAIQGTNDLNQMMNDVLGTVFSIFDCDRIWLFYPCDPDAPSFQVPMEITKPEYPGAKVLNVEIQMPQDMSQNLREALESPDPLTYTIGTEKPINKVSAEQFGVKSMMMTALYPKSGKPWAFGMHQCSIPRIWTEEEKKLFKEISYRISDGLSSVLFLKDLQESEEKFSNAFRFSPVALSITSMNNMKYIGVNESFLKLTGYDSTEVIGQTRADLNLWVQSGQFQDFMKELQENGSVKNFEFAFRCKNGELKYGLRSATLLTMGGERCILAQTYDITEKKKAEDELRLSEQRKTLMNKIANIFLTISNNEMYFEVLNIVLPTLRSKFGVFGFIGKSGDLIIPSFKGDVWSECKVRDKSIVFPATAWGNSLWGKAIREKQSFNSDGPFNVPKGHLHVEHFLAVPITYANETIGLISIANNERSYSPEEKNLLESIAEYISPILNARLQRDLYEEERKAAEELLRLSEKELKEAQRIGAFGNWEWDATTDTIMWSEEYYRIYGFDPTQKPPGYEEHLKVYTAESAMRLDEAVKHSMQTGEPYVLDLEQLHPDGTRKWLTARGECKFDSTGKIIGLRGTSQDITERKRTESLIFESEKRFKELANLLPQTIFESDINGVITFANETGLITFGYSLEDISKGFHMISMVSEKDKLEAIGNIQRILEGLSPTKNEYEMVRKDGTTFPALTFNSPIIRNGKAIGLRGTIVDITQRKLVENELRKLSEAVAQSPASIVITDLNGNIVYVNKTFEETTGYSFDEVINQNPRILKSGFMPKEEYAKLWGTITSGNTWHGEFQNKKKNGEVYWEDAFISPIKDKDGNTINYLAVKQDITEKKKMTEELIAAKDQAEKSDKLKSEFLAQMSHEIRSPMNVTINLASLIKEDLGDKINEQTAAYFEGIELASKRLIRTVDLILNISEMQVGTYSPTFEKVDLLNDILENLRKEFSAYANYKGLEYKIQSTISKTFVYCDRYSVNQILCNLIDNAIKYTQKGKVEITVEQDLKENVKVTVSDTGIGISDEFMNKIFQPFMQEDRGYSRRYEGTGLGLALVKKYCDLNEATIDVKSEKGKGSKFIVTFFKKER